MHRFSNFSVLGVRFSISLQKRKKKKIKKEESKNRLSIAFMTMNRDRGVLHCLGFITPFCLFETGISNGGFAIEAVLVTHVTFIIEIYRSSFVSLFLYVILV